jgi:Dyp-type peroxidase family
MAGREVDWEQVQGIVLSSYAHKPVSRYFLLTIEEPSAARAWLNRELQPNSGAGGTRKDGWLDQVRAVISWLQEKFEKSLKAGDAYDPENPRSDQVREVIAWLKKQYQPKSGRIENSGWLGYAVDTLQKGRKPSGPCNISFGDDRTSEGPSLNIAFTLAGLERLGLPKDAIDTFPWDFRDGMTSPLRRRILADRDCNDPDDWAWGGEPEKSPHVLIILYAPNRPDLERWTSHFWKEWNGAFKQINRGSTPSDGYRPEDQREHFGFVDGLSQPAIESSPRAHKFRERGDIDGIVRPGEFILGYINERGQLPVSPSVALVRNSKLPIITDNDRSEAAQREKMPPPRMDFGRNGTFLVYRQLEQNVLAFDKLINDQAIALGDVNTPRLSDESDFRRLLAAKIIGRWDDGTSLTLAPRNPPVAGANLKAVNNFGYANEDRYGLRCPIGAHVRRANPRDSVGDDRKFSTLRTKRHRLLRRGRLYGAQTKWYAWDNRERTDDGNVQRGLHFVAINASIESQFEFIQQLWMNTPFFGDLVDEIDPLTGVPEDGERKFTVQGTPINRRIRWEIPLVTVRGGAYFFLPSRAALEFLAADLPISAI